MYMIYISKIGKINYQLQVRMWLFYENHNLTEKRLQTCYTWGKTNMHAS